MSRPDFGKHVVTHDGMKLECRYVAPGLTIHALAQIFAKAHDSPDNSEFAGNPAKWPDVAGVIAVTDAILDAIYGPDTGADDSTEGKGIDTSKERQP